MILIISVVVMLCLGLLYAWSVFVAPLEEEFGWLRIQTSITFTITMCCFTIGNFLASFITLRKGIKPALLLSSVLVLVGIGGASQIHTLKGFYLTYGVACGLGVGIAYNVILSNIIRWFPDRQGLATGVVLMGFGTGSMLLGTGAALLIQRYGWRNTLLIISLMFAVVLVCAALLITVPPEDAVFPAQAKKMLHISPVDVRPREMLCMPAFYFYFFWTVMIISGGLMAIGNAAPIAVEIGASTELSVLLVGVLSMCNGFGRVFFGVLYDRCGLKSTLIIATGIFTLSGVLLGLAFIVESILCAAVSYVLVGFACGSVSAITAIYLQEFYGLRYLSGNISCASVNTLVTSLIGPPIAGAIQTSTGSYAGAVFLLPIFALLAFISIPGSVGKNITEKIDAQKRL